MTRRQQQNAVADGVGGDGCCPSIRNGDGTAAGAARVGGGREKCPPVLSPPPMAVSPPSAFSEEGPLNFSSNILLVYRLQAMRQMENVNFALALACLVYCGLNIALIAINYVNSHNEHDIVSERTFHMLEFWGTFFFAVVECVSLTSTPKSLANVYDNPLALRLLLFFNVVASFLPAVLISLNFHYFEIVSHQVEYLNELTLSFVDLVLLWSLCGFQTGTSLVLAGIASLVALVQLAVYNGMGVTPEGDMAGEVPAHYLEFAFGIISSLIAFCFCLDNKFDCGKEIGEILYGTHRYCDICAANSTDFEGTYLKKPGLTIRYGSV